MGNGPKKEPGADLDKSKDFFFKYYILWTFLLILIKHRPWLKKNNNQAYIEGCNVWLS